ncbi:hypothetical protein PIB30_033570 [Stylosanthes scabra]|uniref:Uncharacterized protein n=1 Tax=Stylosanthes scabra TaxID=79078 RepID=A0ABU6WDI5_9FABA|nr:hypothetical protein [Stylosanthes scabra]
MAYAVVSFVLENLSQLLAQEVNLLYGVEDKVRSLHSELKIISALLKASEGKKSKKEIEQEVLSQIRDVAYEAGDVIDTFVANMAMHKRRNKLWRMLHGFDHAKLRHDVAGKIDSIKATINEIRDNKIKYDVFQQEGEPMSTREDEERVVLLHKKRRNVEEDDVVGFVHDSKVIIKRLFEEDSQSNVVSIIGMGGLGKTTLARKVYKSDEVKEHFHCRVWVYVSNDCKVKDLLLAILKHLMPNREYEYERKKKGKKERDIEKPIELSTLSEDELKLIVHDYLKMRRYLLVLDDLWKTQDWDEIQDALPNDNDGSKILITSRLKEVATHTSQDPPFYLQLLSDEDSWELFSKRVFRGEEFPFDIEHLGKQIVKSCRGLPLSIVVLAGLLANKEKSCREWSKVVGHVNWYLTQDETQVKDIVLKLSYDNLPKRLKPCFLYFGVFPEDFEIPVQPLLQKWIAEGFIQQTGTRCPEDVAEDYLHELIDRSLVQVARVKRISGGVKTCRIHDLLRDLCISESKEDKLFEVCMDGNILARKKPRRLSIHCSMHRYVSSTNYDHSCVRSFFLFDSSRPFNYEEWAPIFKCFKLIRVLDIAANMYVSIPSKLGLFIHLRYLRVHLYDGKNIIPNSICTLPNLQTLDLVGQHKTALIWFSGKLWKLKQLRHAYMVGYIMLCKHCHLASDDVVMWNLQTISISLNSEIAYLLKKGSFPKLQKLGLEISSHCKDELRSVLPSLQQVSHLKKLRVYIEWKNYEGIMPSNFKFMEWHIGCKPHELLQGLQDLPNLSTLKIHGALDLPKYDVTYPACITKLTLEGISGMNADGMKAMGNLTRLRILRLCGVISLTDSFGVTCTANSFPQLQEFEMKYLNVHTWELANGAMPCLQHLLIEYCQELDDLPNELWSLTALTKVQVFQPSEALSRRLRNLEMKDGCELIIKEGYYNPI